ncbi:MAG: cyclic nucleotide-binding domain-containing protein [Pseudomonadota bacterium]
MELSPELIEEFASPGKLVGHLSYMLLVASMMMRSMKWLRIIAISAGVVSAVYGYFWLKDFVTVFWEVVFVSVNLIQLLILEVENRRAKFSDYEQRFIECALPGVEKAHAKRLLKRASLVEYEPGTILTHEGEVVTKLHFILEGAVRIDKANAMIGFCGHNDFIGEIAFMLGTKATATAVVTNAVRSFTFDHETLNAALAKDESLRHAMESSFNRNLVGKLVKSNEGTGSVSVPAPLGKSETAPKADNDQNSDGIKAAVALTSER